MFIRKFISSAVLAGALLALALPAVGWASQLVLANGDRLTGKVTKRENGMIYFHSDVLGDIAAPANLVTIVEPPPTAVPSQSLAGLPPKPAAVPTAAAPPAGPGYTGWWWPWWVAKPFMILKPVVTHWTGKVEFGYDNDLTTIRTVTTTTRIEAERTIGADTLQLKGLYLYGSSDEVPTTDQDEFDFRWRHQLDDRWFTQANTSYGSDKIRLIDDNIEQEAALGYKLFSNSRQSLDVGAGVTGQYLDATGVQKGADYLGDVFQDYTYKINGRYTLSEDISADFSPDRRAEYGVTAIGTAINKEASNYDYKFHTTLQGKISDRLSINLHFEYDYDNAVLDPAARAEQHITTTLGYGF
jgi:putative salt-induced outer membrane protein YdiY